MDIRNNTSKADRQRLNAADNLIFTNGCNVVGQTFLNGFAIAIRRGQNGLCFVGCQAKGNLANRRNEFLELFVLGHEVGLAVNFDCRALGAVYSNANETFGRCAAGFLGSGGKALGAQQVNGGFDITLGFFKRLFGVHHASTGKLTQFLDG